MNRYLWWFCFALVMIPLAVVSLWMLCIVAGVIGWGLFAFFAWATLAVLICFKEPA